MYLKKWQRPAAAPTPLGYPTWPHLTCSPETPSLGCSVPEAGDEDKQTDAVILTLTGLLKDPSHTLHRD